MKITQITIAILTTTFATILWSVFYWDVINPSQAFYQKQPLSIEIKNSIEQIPTGFYQIQANTDTESKHILWLDVVEGNDNSLIKIAKIIGINFLVTLFMLLTIVGSGLHRAGIFQRFFVIIFIGIVVIFQGQIAEIFNDRSSWQLNGIQFIFEAVYWIIIAISLSTQAGIKKRNIFLDK